MSLIKWEPFEEFDKIFNDFPVASQGSIGKDLAIDLYDEEKNIIAEMSLPGVDAEKIDVSIEGEYLRVRGTREDVQEHKKKNFYSKEIRRGSFDRAVRLPVAINKDEVSAEYEDGMLRVSLPKATETPSNKIQVTVKK
jgi:HSP20 family protein